MGSFKIDRFRKSHPKNSRYARYVAKLQSEGLVTTQLEEAVDESLSSLNQHKSRAFVIYGEPQSGKTQMMIGLTARLLDEGHRMIIVLLNDNVQLLKQNLLRFQSSGLDPTAQNYSEVMDSATSIADHEWVLFCKKNGSDLRNLTGKLGSKGARVVIDDEADYATPNSKVNKNAQTPINELVEKLIGSEGVYIGVTATPARLDLNNTFQNDTERWVDFKPHNNYTGPEVFFPLSVTYRKFSLKLVPDHGDEPAYLRDALFRYFAAVAYLNTQINDKEEFYSILVHTSGVKADHTTDYKNIQRVFSILRDHDHKDYERHCHELWDACKSRYPGLEDELTEYVIERINRSLVVVMNSNSDKNVVDYEAATDPRTLFTVAIGGNIVSRGVTFNSLLSMFFTRDAKHKIQQDTYIQRARMFGVRGKYLEHFELTIPETLYFDWHRCFVFHRLALDSIRANGRAPAWLEDQRISVTAAASIDRSVVNMNSGEMSFEKFTLDENLLSAMQAAKSMPAKLKELSTRLPNGAFPEFLYNYTTMSAAGDNTAVAVHEPKSVQGYGGEIAEQIQRSKGFLGQSQLNQHPRATHHFAILFNEANEARLFYKFVGNIRFLQRVRPQGTAQNMLI